ncbi:MAG: hypothetical protein K6F07_03700 [Bacilli bacterium]|nr:hypothetical protein [Bacilli bacterium]
MALFKKKKTVEEPPRIEDRQDFKKLIVFVTIVNRGLASPITKIFQNMGCSAQFVQRGNGTAVKEIRDILGIEDTSKDIVFSIVREEKVEDIKVELSAFFLASKYNKGIAFTIPMSSMIGVKVYQFLANTL